MIASTSRGKTPILRRANAWPRFVSPRCMSRRAAAPLSRGDHGLDAVGCQHAQRRPVDVGIKRLLDAAGQQRHPGTARADGRVDPGQRLCSGQFFGEQPQHGAQRLGREAVQRTCGSSQRRRDAKTSGIGQGLLHQNSAYARHDGPRPQRLRVRPIGRDQLAISHARRTGRDAAQTGQAAIHVRQRLLHGQAALERRLHQEDAAARRIHLLAQLAVGGAGGQTETAVNARFDRMRHDLALRPQSLNTDRVLHLNLHKTRTGIQRGLHPPLERLSGACAKPCPTRLPQHDQPG